MPPIASPTLSPSVPRTGPSPRTHRATDKLSTQRDLRRRQRAAYAQMRRAFGLVPEPLSLFAPVPSLLLTGWACLRESLICGTIPRRYKEAVAVAISRGADCPYCVDAHSLLAAATGISHGDLATLGAPPSDASTGNPTADPQDPQLQAFDTWARATFHRTSAPVQPPCTPDQLPELLGTALCFHYIHRLTTILLGDSPLPSAVPGLRPTLLRLLPRPLGLAVRLLLGRHPQPGASLPLIPAPWADLPQRPEFAPLAPRPNIQHAFSAFRHAAEAEVRPYLPSAPRQLLEEHLDGWDGEPLGLTDGSLDEMLAATEPEHRAALRLAFLTARAPHRVTAATLEEFRRMYPGEGPAVALLAWTASRTAFGMMGWWSGGVPDSYGPTAT